MNTERYKHSVQLVLSSKVRSCSDMAKAMGSASDTNYHCTDKGHWSHTIESSDRSASVDLMLSSLFKLIEGRKEVVSLLHTEGQGLVRIFTHREISMASVEIASSSLATVARYGFGLCFCAIAYGIALSDEIVSRQTALDFVSEKEVWVDIAFSDRDLDIDSITEMMNLQPLTQHRMGDPIKGNIRGKLHTQNRWAYGFRSGTESPDSLVRKICDLVMMKGAVIEELGLNQCGTIVVSVFLNAPDAKLGHIGLSPETVKLVARTNCSLSLSVYV